MTEQKKKAPIQTLRDGAVVVKIWERNGKNGPYPSATLGRTYQNEQTGEWGESRTLGRADVLKAQALLLEANREMAKWQEYYKEQQQAQAPQAQALQVDAPQTDASQADAPTARTGLAAQRDQALANAKPATHAATPTATPNQERGPDL